MNQNEIKVLTYNIHKGMSAGNFKDVLSQIRDQLRTIHADIVFLQEVSGVGTDSQFEFLADEVWPHYSYGKNAIYSSGHHGNAILSKFPFIISKNSDISTNRFEKRGLLFATVEIPSSSKKIHLGCVHLNLLEGGRKIQTKTMCQILNAEVPTEEPLILAGDFNDWRGRITSELSLNLSLKEAFLSQNNEHAKSFPSFSPIAKLDRIYFRHLTLKNSTALKGKQWSRLSDHTPLTAEFIL